MTQPELHPIAEAMPEEAFWHIVDASWQAALATGLDPDDTDNFDALCEAQRDALTNILRQAGWQDILRFRNRFSALHAAAYRSDLWCAAFIMNGGCSDDGFMDFRAWLISRGQAVYTRALAKPDSLADLVTDPEYDFYSFGDFIYGLDDVFSELTHGADMDEYLAGEAREPELTGFEWEEDDEDSMRRICPRLMDLFYAEDEDEDDE